MRLEGRTAVVTGAGRGIGAVIARQLAAEGAAVLVSARTEDEIAAVAAELDGAHWFACDVTDADRVSALAAFATDKLGRVDILVNNAGHSSKARSLRYVSRQEWDSVLNVNLTGVYALCQAVLPGMLERGEGTIITVSSMAAIRPGILGGAAYSAAKAGVLNLMGDINGEFGSRGIRACTILPAEVDTPILEKRPLPPDTVARSTMMGPEDIAEIILLCATLPQRTVIERVIVSPTTKRDQSADIEAARLSGAPRD